MGDPGPVDSQHFSLGILRLQDELALLRAGSLYWLACAEVDDADALCRQTLAAMAPGSRAALLVGGREPEALLRELDAEAGPDELALYAFAERQGAAALEQLSTELEQILRPRGRLLLLVLSADCWEAFAGRRLRDWCARMRAWLAARDCSLLVLSHGEAPLQARLQACNEYLAGLAQLYRLADSLHYRVLFWRNGLGVNGRDECELAEEAGGLARRLPALPAQGDTPALLPRTPPLADESPAAAPAPVERGTPLQPQRVALGNVLGAR